MGRKPFERREFIKAAGVISGGVLVTRLNDRFGLLSSAAGEQAKPQACQCSSIVDAQGINGPRVVHVHATEATSWNFASGWYGNYVDLVVVNDMVERGLQLLTGQSSMADAWDALFQRVRASGYQPGEKIAVKINLNNADGCSDGDNSIDALPQPIMALIRSLKGVGVREQDIWIYDATVRGRYIPDRVRGPIESQYPGVGFYGRGACGGVNQVAYSQTDPDLRIQFSDPGGHLSDRWLPDLLGEAAYLINMPILKYHGIHPVTLGFKNHFGSLNNIVRAGSDSLHEYINPTSGMYSAAYSPLVDIYSQSVIRDKTVLTVGDGLYGSLYGATQAPVRWSSFGDDAPSSLLLSVDPVAIDCVMTDLIRAERSGMGSAYDYLFCAQDAGLGSCEGTRQSPGGDPWGRGYDKLDYLNSQM
jgi:hypothetical protein